MAHSAYNYSLYGDFKVFIKNNNITRIPVSAKTSISIFRHLLLYISAKRILEEKFFQKRAEKSQNTSKGITAMLMSMTGFFVTTPKNISFFVIVHARNTMIMTVNPNAVLAMPNHTEQACCDIGDTIFHQ